MTTRNMFQGHHPLARAELTTAILKMCGFSSRQAPSIPHPVMTSTVPQRTASLMARRAVTSPTIRPAILNTAHHFPHVD